HHEVCAARAGEARRLRIAAKLQRDFARAFHFVDRVRNLRIADVGLVRAVEEDDGLVLLRVGNPRGELRLGGDGAGGVVREAEVDQIGRDARYGRHVAIGGCALEISDALIPAVDVRAGAAGHDVRVDVYRINRIGNREADGAR